ncbi:MAG TPA: hypothetical protein VF174_13295 [Micromonosporaceae bacterium]
MPTQHRSFGADQAEAAADDHGGWLAPLGEIPVHPAEECQQPGSAQRERRDEQIEPAALGLDLGGEDPLGDEQRRIAQVEHPGTHAAVGGDRIDGYLGSTVVGESGYCFYRRYGVPGRRRLPVDSALDAG